MSDERVARAGEYVLGLMDDEERRLAEHDLETDADFRAAVRTAEKNFHKLDLTATPEPVPDSLWPKISERIAGTPQDISASSGKPGRRWGIHSLGNTRGFALAASLVAACAIGYFGAVATTRTPQPIVVVVLDTSENVPGAIFEAFDNGSVRIVPLQDFVVPEGQTMQVWTLYDQAVGPVSLGTIGRDVTEVRLKGPPLPLPKADQLYEITLEPAPGSPTGKPTGPILVKGFARTVPG